MGIECMRALRLVVLTVLVCVVGYTSLLLLATSVIAPKQRMGSLLLGPNGGTVGSRLLAQGFTRPEYLWPRPSAVDYNGAGGGGSNLSPTHSKIRERAETILAIYDLPNGQNLPADLVLASGSGSTLISRWKQLCFKPKELPAVVAWKRRRYITCYTSVRIDPLFPLRSQRGWSTCWSSICTWMQPCSRRENNEQR